ncbi:hypothetical protein NMY22_g14628 [Coprinellus aureogranulatus]|nr:hypothetical protein NMY22_g14628 [Coprinellus aureogranulatus]
MSTTRSRRGMHGNEGASAIALAKTPGNYDAVVQLFAGLNRSNFRWEVVDVVFFHLHPQWTDPPPSEYGILRFFGNAGALPLSSALRVLLLDIVGTSEGPESLLDVEQPGTALHLELNLAVGLRGGFPLLIRFESALDATPGLELRLSGVFGSVVARRKRRCGARRESRTTVFFGCETAPEKEVRQRLWSWEA